MSCQEKAPRKSQDQPEGLCFLAGLGTPQDPDERPGRSVRGEGNLDIRGWMGMVFVIPDQCGDD